MDDKCDWSRTRDDVMAGAERTQCDQVSPSVQPMAVDLQSPADAHPAAVTPTEGHPPDAHGPFATHSFDEDPHWDRLIE
jgi:hypothetical protein